MDVQNLAYTLIQVVHNFGAVGVVGAAFLALRADRLESDRRRYLAWLVLFAWSVQILSGAGFGAVSFYFYGQFPDIHGAAIAALIVKVICAMTGIVLALAYLRLGPNWSAVGHARAWQALASLGVVALTAAAVLRWFS